MHDIFFEPTFTQTETGPDAAKVTKVLEILHKGTMRHYNGFIQSLIESDQMEVVTDILKEDITKYKLNKTGR